ncbi:flagellar biosynthesis protein FliO [Bradyrhizobium macuxiense]|uniref:Flagellar biosynthesis protein FliO n=1 Tax=Bradyrhizobium macuxiense TaxID=1755647 RepID=A0A109JCS0_9BRAD|nr:flagellar biosynthetic protein FliO [Bradyrhizobium macuxiense]KWV46499.1 flagellar biosynthesis protein FliO [Bradyrhizobium macuxiense]
MQALTFVFAFVAVLALIGVAAWLVRRFGGNPLGANANRGRMPRLAVIDAAAVDGRRRLVLVRRDNVEHLLMIGGPSDIVVEPNIVRASPGRDQMSARPAVATDSAPPRVAPLPDAAWNESEAARTDFDQEPQLPELPSRPARPSFADEVRRSAPASERRSDPLTGFTPERTEPRPDPMPQRLPRSEPAIPRPPRAAEPPKAPPPLRAPERAAAAPLPQAATPTPPAPPPPPSNADANLAEMAQRLEAALRRPSGGGDTVAPPVAPEAPPVRPPRSEPPASPASAPQKSGFENLEDEMASLLGRPKNPS